MREVIEWCSEVDTDHDEPGEIKGYLAVMGGEEFIRLVLADQERQEGQEDFGSWPPTAEELEQYNAAMTADDEMVLQETQKQVVPC